MDIDRTFFIGIIFGAGAALAWFGIAGAFAAINRARIRREIDTRQEARRREAERRQKEMERREIAERERIQHISELLIRRALGIDERGEFDEFPEEIEAKDK